MKKYLLLTCLSLVGLSSTKAQSPSTVSSSGEPKGYVGLSLGPAFPVGDFGDNDFNNTKAGFAKPGFHIALVDFGYKFHPNFGITATWMGAACQIDAQKMADEFAMAAGTTTKVETKAWGLGALSVGPFASIPMKMVDVDFRLMFGLYTGISPEITVTVGNSAVITQGSETASALGIDAGMGVRFHVASKVDLMMHIDYVSVKPEFTVTATSAGYAESSTFKQEMNVVNAGIGVAYRIK